MPVTIAVLGLLAVAAFYGVRSWFRWAEGNLWMAILVAAVVFLSGLAWHLERRR